MKKNELTEFQNQVYKSVCQIPKGFVSTYISIAKRIGKPNSARAVGNALNRNPFAPQVPCHRIIKSDGRIGGFAKGNEKKIRMLKKEGIGISRGRLVELEKIMI